MECWPQRSEASTEGAPTVAECQPCPVERTEGERGGGGGGRAYKLGQAWCGVNWLIYKGLRGDTTTKLLRDYLNVRTLRERPPLRYDGGIQM